MRLDPIDNAISHFSDLAKQMDHDAYVEREMHNQKETALEKLKSIVHPEFVEEFSAILAFGIFECVPEAEKISEILFLSELEIAGISEDFNKTKILLQDRYQDTFYEEVI